MLTQHLFVYKYLCQAHGVEALPASATFCTSTFGSRFTQTHWRLFTRICVSQTDSVKMVLSCLRNGRLVHQPCIMGFYWGRVMRRSVCLGLKWRLTIGRMRCCFPESTHTHTHTHNPHSLHISRLHTNIVALIFLMNKLVLSLPVCLCVCYMCGVCVVKTECICSQA